MATTHQPDGKGFAALTREVWTGANKHQIWDRAAELAFWFLLGFFPLLVAIAGLIALFGAGLGPQGEVLRYLGDALPSGVSALVHQVFTRTTGGAKTWLSLAFAIWSASSATSGLITALNDVHSVEESRSWWKAKLLALALSLGLCVLLLIAVFAMAAGPKILQVLFSSTATTLWTILRWPAAILVLLGALILSYHYAPNIREPRWRSLVPGTVIATILWIAASALFKVYVAHFAHYGSLYGSVGTLVVLMFWFYLSGLAILVGAEVNVAIEHRAARPHPETGSPRVTRIRPHESIRRRA